MSVLLPAVAVLLQLTGQCFALSQYRIGALNPKGQAGYTFRFCIRMHPLLFKDVKENTFQIQLFWKNSSKVQQNCLVTADEEEDYPVQMQDGTVTSVDAPISYTRVRVFEFKIMDPGEYGVSAKPTVDFMTDKSRQQQGPKLKLRRLGVNTETVNINQSKLLEDIQTAFITVLDDRSNLKYDDCILTETFTINGDEAKPNYPDRPTYIDDAESIMLKRTNNRVCSNRQTIRNKWFLERIKISDTETSMGICPNYRKVGLMDLAKYVSMKTRLPLKLNMSLPSLVIQPYVLPSDRYHVCVDLFRTDYSRRVCGYFETHVENAQYAMIVHVKPEEEKLTWPKGDLTINASQTVYLYETIEAGYLLAPTLRFKWSCEGDDFVCENILSQQHYSTRPENDTKEVSQQFKTDSLMLIKKEWMVEKVTLVIKCQISIKSKDSTQFTTSFLKEITFLSHVDQIEVPYIQIRCLTNCWRFAVPKEDILLGVVCNDCEEFTLKDTQIAWEISDPDVRSNSTSTLYLEIRDLEDSRSKDILVRLIFDYKHPESGTRVSVNTTRRFYLAERFDEKSVESFSFKKNRETLVRNETSLRSTDFSAVLTALDEEYHYPLIYNLKALGKDVENIDEFDLDVDEDSCRPGETPLTEFHSCVILTATTDWDSSVTNCRQVHISADLTIILSQRKNDVLKSLSATSGQAWIGMQVVNGKPQWMHNVFDAHNYSNWHVKGKSTNSSKTQCVYMDADGQWRLADCEEPIGAICEYFPYKKQRRYSMLISPTIPTDFVYESSDADWEVYITVYTAMGILVHTRNQNLQRQISPTANISFVFADLSIARTYGLTHLGYLTGELDRSSSIVRAQTVAKILKKMTENRPVLDYGSLNVVLVSLERLVCNIEKDITNLIRAHTLLSKVVKLHTQAPNFRENDYILNKYELHIVDLLIQVFLKLRHHKLLPGGPEMIILSEGIMRTLDDILTLIVGKKAKGYPDILHYKLIHSHSFVTWVDCSQRQMILMDLNTVSLNMDMKIFFSAVNLFSLDPFLNIGAYTSSYSPMPDRIGDIEIHLPLLVVHVRQKQPTQYALSEFVPDLYDIRFKTDLSSAASKNYLYRIKVYDEMQTEKNTTTFSESDCVLIKLAMSKDFSTVLRVRSEVGLKLQVRIMLAKHAHDVLGIMHESPLLLPREVDPNVTKSASINEDDVFLPKLTLEQDYKLAGGAYYMVVSKLPGQKYSSTTNKSGSKDTSVVSINCFQLSCTRWSFYDNLWTSQFCRSTPYTVGSKPMVNCICDGGRVFSGGSSPCAGDPGVNWDMFELAAMEFTELTDHTLFLTFVLLYVYMVFFALLYWAWKKDRRERRETRTHVLPELFSPYCPDNYMICIVTGIMHNCGTTSIPNITLVGENSVSFRVSLAPLGGLFQTGSEVWFLLSCNKVLGNLTHILVSLDQEGKNKSWFISHIFIRDLKTYQEWYCIFDTWLPDPVSKQKYLFIPASKSHGSHARLRLHTFLRRIRKHHLVIGIFYNVQGCGYSKTQHVVTCLFTLLLIMCIILFSLGVAGPILKGDDSRERLRTEEKSYTASTFVAVGISSVVSYGLSIFLQKSNHINEFNALDWKTSIPYNPNEYQETEQSSKQDLDLDDVDASPMSVSEQHEGYDVSTNANVRSPISETGSPPIYQAGSPADSPTTNSRRRFSPHGRYDSPPYETVGSPVDSGSGEDQVLSYYEYNFCTENLSLKYEDKKWKENIYTRRKPSFRASSSKFIFTCFLLVPSIVSMSYMIIAFGFFLQRDYAYVFWVLVSFLVVSFVAHPFFVFMTLLLTEGDMVMCKKNADKRWKAGLETLFTGVKCMVLNKLDCRKLVNTKNYNLSPSMLSYSMKLSRTFHSGIKKEDDVAKGPSASDSGLFQQILTIIYIILVIYIINLKSGNVRGRYMQNNFLKQYLQVGRAEIDLEQALTIEQFWEHLRESLNIKAVELLNNAFATSTYEAVSNGRLQQLRVKNETNCKEKYKTLIEPSCHWDIEEAIQETRNFAFTWEKSTTREVPPGPYTYTQTTPFHTIAHSYPSGGYQVMYSLRENKPEMIDFLKSKKWVDVYTRAVRVHLALFNADTKLVTSIEHVYEFTAAGIFQDTVDIETFNLFYDEDTLKVLRGLIGVLVVFNILFLVMDVVQIYNQGFVNHLSSIHAWLNIFERGSSFAVFVLFVLEFYTRKDAIQNVQNVYFENREASVYINFDDVTSVAYYITLASCLLASIIFIKVLLKSNNIPSLSQFLQLVPPVVEILYFPMLTIMCYALMGHKFFFDLDEFSTYRQSCFSTTNMFLNQDVLKRIVEYRVVGMLFIVLSYSVMNYIVINYFIVLLSEHYSRIREEQTEEECESIFETMAHWYKSRLTEDEQSALAAKAAAEERLKQQDPGIRKDSVYTSIGPKQVDYNTLIEILSNEPEPKQPSNTSVTDS